MRLTMKVNETREKIDDECVEAKRMFLSYVKEINAASFVFHGSIIEELEHIADSCDGTTDYVRILAAVRENE
jgi:uncharacterized protein Yka (UPF0111/DUF47 family)